ncbi:TlpA family protein disulfide reductase [Mucilaginibacter corticis]|uniref:TlpA family protein disulfide reductase n=1 Tax=Mucilaginibacter corticis TaxID=2597670 RepID=A0A556MUR6_9SPHI|nr:redoxin domain-containing protein [Mucilaginibacter corticis]TSJ43676.1 TlpA family protein disulfide reductase [Mucilaginibacter corticis]
MITENYKKAYDLYNQDFLNYPDLKPKNLLSYYQSVYSPFLNPIPAISDEFEKTWTDSLANGKSELFLNHLALLKMRPGNSSDPELIKKEIIAKYPNGDFAYNDDVKDLSAKIKSGDFATRLTAIEIKYGSLVKKGSLDPVYSELGKKQFVANNIDGAEEYLLKIRSKQTQKQLYLFAANLYLNNNRDLQKAEEFIQQAIALVKFDKQPYYVFDNKSWQKSIGGFRGDYLDISAQIQYRLGNKEEAIIRLKEALQINDYNEKIKEHYIQYLSEAGMTKEALATASDYIINEKETEAIHRQTLQEAFVKDKGSLAGYDVYYNDLLKEAEKQYTIPEYSKLNAPAVDFTLKALDGNMVSLSSFKGKTVVLYFFSSDFVDSLLSASIVGFNQFVKANKDENTVFLAINETAVSDADEANGKPLRIQKLNEYMAANKFSFKVLLDDFKPNPIPNRGNYYVVADDYSANGGGQLYVIDKNGVVKYKSFVYPSLTRALAASSKLVK